MAVGDAAAAAGFTLFSDSMDADQIATAMNQILDYLAPLKVALDEATATATEGKIVKWGTGGRINVNLTPAANANPASKKYVDDQIAAL